MPARPPPPPGAPTTSLLISVPDMMCAASCGSAVRGALDALAGTELVGVNIPRKLAHVRTTQDASAILGALRGVGFPGSVVSEAPGDGIEPAAAPVAAEFALADSLGLLVEGCNARTGGPCNCGPSCMCHFCPEHHPERSAKLMEEPAARRRRRPRSPPPSRRLRRRRSRPAPGRALPTTAANLGTNPRSLKIEFVDAPAKRPRPRAPLRGRRGGEAGLRARRPVVAAEAAATRPVAGRRADHAGHPPALPRGFTPARKAPQPTSTLCRYGGMIISVPRVY